MEGILDDSTKDLIEVGKDGLWEVSSSSYSHGVKNLVDGNANSYWQSTGLAPHSISITFPRITKVKRIDLYLNFKKDESFTPKSIVIFTGSNSIDRKTTVKLEVSEPNGWLPIRIGDPGYVKTHFLQLLFTLNHNLGRDTRVRQMKIWGPKKKSLKEKFRNQDFKQFTGFH